MLLLAKNFGLPDRPSTVFPADEQYFVSGPVPPEHAIPLQGAENLPPLTHKFRMMAQQPHSIHRYGREWRVGKSRFPVDTVTGVVLELDVGGLRELHWHPNADEWQYVIDGDFSVTLFDVPRPLSHRDRALRRRRSTFRKATGISSRTSATRPAAC